MAEVNLTRWQRANLAKLAAYLRTLPKGYPDFEMSGFVKGGNDGEAYVPECGTAACAAGHGPRAGIKPKKGEDWYTYSDRAFVDGSEHYYGWEWVFSGDWADYDNTVHGAAARIEYMLERGTPDEWDGYPRDDDTGYYADRIDAVPA